ncbi:MAG: tetratricopeptide repeat protein [Thermoanaerobaculia bacterium]|nr:tetratricopeptide repeat protein [Thermoanaerobaculia bacterium]
MRAKRTRRPSRPSPLLWAILASLLLTPQAVPQTPGAGDDPSALVDAAMQEVEAGDLEAAVRILRPLRERDDVPDRALALLGSLLVETGRAREAMEVLEPLADELSDPAILYNAGRAALALDQPSRARKLLERSLELQPGTPAARELGLLLGSRGETRRAYGLLKPWALRHPDDTEARLTAARLAVKLRRPRDAEQLLGDLPQSEPRVRILWGKLLLMRDEPRGALSTLEPLLETGEPEMALDARRVMAEAHLRLGETAEARELLIGRVGDDPGLALALAEARYREGDVEAALATLRPFVEGLADEKPASEVPVADLALEYGRLLVAAARFEEAIPHLERATELAPGAKEGWKSLGEALAAAGRREEASAALERFRSIVDAELPPSEREMARERELEDPTGAAMRRAMRLLDSGNPSEALRLVRQEEEIAPGDVRLRLLEAQTLLSLQRPEDALEAANDALEIAPRNPDPWYQRGIVRMALGEIEEAEADLRKALEIAPNHVPALSDLAVLEATRGNREEARRLLERVLELRPDDPMARRHLERLTDGP